MDGSAIFILVIVAVLVVGVVSANIGRLRNGKKD